MEKLRLVWWPVLWILATQPAFGQFVNTVDLFASADASISQESPNENTGDDQVLVIDGVSPERFLIRFDEDSIRQALATAPPASAKLQLGILATSFLQVEVVSLHRMQAAWEEDGVTWNCPDDSKPNNPQQDCPDPWNGGAFDPEPAATALIDPSTLVPPMGFPHLSILEFDVSQEIEAILAGGTHFGWLIRFAGEGQFTPEDGPVEAAFYSREGFAPEPQLIIEIESETVDATPPDLRILSPSSRTVLSSDLTLIDLQFSDGGSGIDPDSLSVVFAPLNIVSGCQVLESQAQCPVPALVEGVHLLSASLSDLAGNHASESFQFLFLDEAGRSSATLSPLADSVVQLDAPDQNRGSETVLEIGAGGPSRSLLRFDQAQIAALLSGGPLLSAILELPMESNGGNWGPAGRLVEAHRLAEDWSEASVTWDCGEDTDLSNAVPDCAQQWSGGAISSGLSDVLLFQNSTVSVQFDVTADVQAFLLGTPNFGWLVKKADEQESGRPQAP